MKKILLLIVIFSVSVVSAVAGVLYTKNIYDRELKAAAEEDRLQGLALTQMLLEALDKDDIEGARRDIIRSLNSYIFVSDSHEYYSYKRIEACKIHKIIYKYRESNKDIYSSVKPEDAAVNAILKAWSKVECE